MKTITLCLVLSVSGLGLAEESKTSAASSPAQQKIAAARTATQKNTGKYFPYNDLAMAFVQRARETADPAFYDQAQEALNNSLRIDPNNFDGRKLEIAILLGQHEFEKARDKARVLNRKVPDDVMIYGYVADAAIELGDYKEAEQSAQWMLNLRPNNTPGLVRGARLRILFGEIDGALQWLTQAYQQTSPREIEEQAWYLTWIASVQMSAGRLEPAEKDLTKALKTFPDCPSALSALAELRSLQQNYAGAVDLLKQRISLAPNVQSQYALAEALEHAGRTDEAAAAYAEFERLATARVTKPDNANRELIFYYAGHANEPERALSLARTEIARRQDVATLDAYAWALYLNDDAAAARAQIEKALAVGIRSPMYFRHASAICTKLNDNAAAARYLAAMPPSTAGEKLAR